MNTQKTILNKISNLPYVNIRESDDLDNFELLYVENNNVFAKKGGCGIYKIDNIENIPLLVEMIFISKIKQIVQPINIKNNDILSTIKTQLNIIQTERKKLKLRISDDIFFLVPRGFNLDGYDVVETDYLEDEIIFGYKNEVDETGIVLVTNESGLIDENNIRLGLFDIGTLPEKLYCLLKIK